MNFVWIAGRQTENLRYSIRSVAKYHPNATVVIIGEKPKWYIGYHYYMPDDNIPSVNKWNKTLKACELFETFVQMDDDFFLLEPYKPKIYYDGMLIHRKVTPNSQYGRMVVASQSRNPKNYLLHTPLPIISRLYPKDVNAESPRQLYCEGCGLREEQMRDVKFTDTLEIKGLPFFSVGHFENVQGKLKQLYPDKSKFEK